jgi:hypothetical protein
LGGCDISITDRNNLWSMPLIASDGMIYSLRFMNIISCIQVILILLAQQSEMLLCVYYYWDGFMMHTIEMTSDGLRYTYQVS